MESQLRRQNICMLVLFQSPRCFFSSFRSSLPTEQDEEETSGNWSSLIQAPCDTLTYFLVKPFSFTITYVDPDITGKRVGENDTQLFSRHWPADDASILPNVTLIVNPNIVSIVNATIGSLPDPRYNLWGVWSCQEESNGDRGPQAHNVTAITNNNTAAGWV